MVWRVGMAWHQARERRPRLGRPYAAILRATGETPCERRRPPKPPSKFPKDWKPEAFGGSGTVPAPAPTAVGGMVPSPPPPLPVVPARPTDGASVSRFAKPDDPPKVKQMFAELEEDMRKQDRWMLKE